MEIFKKSGTHIMLNKQHIVIDPLSNQESDIVLISHGHSDHINIQAFRKLKQPIYLSQPTLEILNERSKTEIVKENVVIIKNGDSLNVNGIMIQAFDAGHCIGSLQFKIMHNQTTIIYTGDFCVETRMGMQKGAILKGKNSTLIIDSTYAGKEYVFPSRMEIYKDILKWIKTVLKTHNNVILFSRQLGTAQELTDLINKSTLNCDILVNPSIYYHNLIHTKYIPLGNFQYRRNLFDKSLDDFLFPTSKQSRRKRVFLLPFFMYNKKYLPELKKVYGTDAMAVCTGWALTGRFSVKAFPLTSHTGYNGIQRYLQESGAKDMMYF
ncbi:MAG: MBL fold metallo-hydrolase [Candidatus Helarchaeota archaeon]